MFVLRCHGQVKHLESRFSSVLSSLRAPHRGSSLQGEELTRVSEELQRQKAGKAIYI